MGQLDHRPGVDELGSPGQGPLPRRVGPFQLARLVRSRTSRGRYGRSGRARLVARERGRLDVRFEIRCPPPPSTTKPSNRERYASDL
jgi:hypothetical protein